MQWGGQNNVVRGQKAGTYNVRGVYSEYFNIETQHILAGRLLNEIDMIEKRKVCLIGNIVREVLFAPDEDPVRAVHTGERHLLPGGRRDQAEAPCPDRRAYGGEAV